MLIKDPEVNIMSVIAKNPKVTSAWDKSVVIKFPISYLNVNDVLFILKIYYLFYRIMLKQRLQQHYHKNLLLVNQL